MCPVSVARRGLTAGFSQVDTEKPFRAFAGFLFTSDDEAMQRIVEEE